MSKRPSEQFPRVLAAPSPRDRWAAVVWAAAVVLALALAAAGIIIVLHRPLPRGLVATFPGPVAFSPDGRTLAVSSGSGGDVWLWDVATQSRVATLASPRCTGDEQVAFSPDGTTLAVFSSDSGTTCLWDVATRKQTATLASRRCTGSAQALFSPDGKTLALLSGTLAASTCVWDVATRRLAVLNGLGRASGSAVGAFSPDGETLAVSATDGNIYLWDVAARRVTATLANPDAGNCLSYGSSVAFSPDGTTLAGADECDEQTYLWDAATGRRTATLTDPAGSGDGVYSLAFGRDGQLAIGDENGCAYLWDIATARLTATISQPMNRAQGNASITKQTGIGIGDGGPFPGPGDFAQNVTATFSPAGKILAADVSFGYGTYLYDVATRKRVATLTDPGGRDIQPGLVAFSPDGTLMAVLDNNGRTYLWSLPRLSLAA
jgi:WD40 repeat protein